MMKGKYTISVLSNMLVITFMSLFLACSIGTQKPILPKSGNERLTTEAWQYLGKNDYNGAISKAEECTSSFRSSAEKIQNHLLSANEVLPPTGSVSDEMKKTIFNRGLLNDVATCYFIMGKAYQGKKDLDSAAIAFQNAKSLTYARTWDPNGWFWSPSEAATKELKRMGK
jgi:hypothetical protein